MFQLKSLKAGPAFSLSCAGTPRVRGPGGTAGPHRRAWITRAQSLLGLVARGGRGVGRPGGWEAFFVRPPTPGGQHLDRGALMQLARSVLADRTSALGRTRKRPTISSRFRATYCKLIEPIPKRRASLPMRQQASQLASRSSWNDLAAYRHAHTSGTPPSPRKRFSCASIGAPESAVRVSNLATAAQSRRCDRRACGEAARKMAGAVDRFGVGSARSCE